MQPCDKSVTSQQWYFSGQFLQNRNSNKCMQLTRRRRGKTRRRRCGHFLYMVDCDSGKNDQKWAWEGE